MGPGLTARVLLFVTLCHLATGQVRLMVGSEDNTGGGVGRVEARLGGQWLSVCNTQHWHLLHNAVVACRAAGYPGGGVTYFNMTSYGRGSSVFFLDNVNCTGSENTLLNCPYNVSVNCGVVGVICNRTTATDSPTTTTTNNNTTTTVTATAEPTSAGSTTAQTTGATRLMAEGEDNTGGGAGRVEVWLGGQWLSVCYTQHWHLPHNAVVACRAAGYPGGGVTFFNMTSYGPGSSGFHLNDVNCTGTEASLLNCQYVVTVGCDVVGVICNSDDNTAATTVALTSSTTWLIATTTTTIGTTSTTTTARTTTTTTTTTTTPTTTTKLITTTTPINTTQRTTAGTERVSVETGDLCGQSPCPYNSYCFRGTVVRCYGKLSCRCDACNAACDECTGPGADECIRCKRGYHTNAQGSCILCTAGTYGDNCNGTCHCLEATACDPVTGQCQGKCEKGYYAPPDCRDQCPDGTYGLDCLEECHCLNDSVCDKVLGFCPNNLCHPDWTSVGCSKRLPKLAFPPEVVMAGCTYLTVRWLSWKEDIDFGDLPIAQYRLYKSLNSTDPPVWMEVVRIMHNSSRTSYTVNVTSLQADAFYRFRVDVHYNDDGKVVEKTSQGIESEPAFVPCTTTTEPPPVTVPIILGTEVFDMMQSTNLGDGTMEVIWSIDPDLRRFTWSVTLQYRKVGIGNCQPVSEAIVTMVPVNQTQTTFRLMNPELWSKYEFTLTAQGSGIISAVNGSETMEAISAETAPTGVVSNLRTVATHPRSATLSWTNVPCSQRGGVLVQFDVSVEDTGGKAQGLLTNVTSLSLDGLTPYTQYSVRVRYVNSVGPGDFSPPFNFTTLEDVPGSVTITSLESSPTTIAVYLQPPVNTNGVLLEYQIQYSNTPEFLNPESLTVNASTPGTPVIRRLTPYTDYYVRVRAATNAGYGQFGNVMTKRTLQARPFPPPRLAPTLLNSSCIGVVWDLPDTSMVPVAAYVLKALVVETGLVAWSVQLAVNISQYTQCDLQPATTYNVTIQSMYGGSQGTPTWALFTTEHLAPPPPRPPLLVNVSTTTAAVQLFALMTGSGYPITAYQVEVEWQESGRRRKRHSQVPGTTVAQLTPSELGESYVLVIGDENIYGGFSNNPLLPGQTYSVYFVVLSTLNNLTKFSYSKMATNITTLTPATTTLTPPNSQPEGNVEGWVWGIIVALILITIIILAIILLIWWRRRGSMLMTPPYLELDEEVKKKLAHPRETYNPEKYWNQIKTIRESRYIVAGRECLPDSQLVPVGEQQRVDMPLTFKQEFKTLPHWFKQATTHVAEQHPDRNRFPHILAYDHSRVELAADSHSSCPYINANYMSAYKCQRAYIAAQSPYNDVTAIDFWRLIHQQAIKTIVMITNVVEDNIVKCTQYWPDQQGTVTIGQFLLELLEVTEYADFTIRDISVCEGQQQHGCIVRLYEFTSWPDHGVPDDPIPFLDMRHKVRQYHGDDPGPILVHCGTGVARTGVFIAVDSLIDQYAAEGRISVFSFVRKMRKERPMMVRTCKQYVFIYEAIFEEFQAGRTMVDTETLKPMYHEWTQMNYKTNRSYLRDQFQLLQRLTRGPEEADCTAALLPINAHRNRYPDVLPSDLFRPILTTPAPLSKTDYINAVFVDGYRRRNQFLLTQTPLPTTIVDFWRLVYDYHVQTIVMMENHQHQPDTCAEYWTSSDLNKKLWEPFLIETTATFQEDNVTIRNLKLKIMEHPHDPPRTVRQFQFNAWATNSFTPVSKTMAMDLMDLVLDYQDSSESPDSPIVVHCEDGATHSGLFVALTLLCERMEEEGEVDVYRTIKHIKRRRPQVINDYYQFRFCYKALWDYMNLRMPGGLFTETLGQNKTDKIYGVASLSLTSYQDSI